MTEKYYIITQNEDGEASVNVLSKEQIEKVLGDGDFNEFNIVNNVPHYYIENWGNNMIIIKGEIVVPKPIKQVVTKWEI
jgi:hypothetical protein